jgi:DMSO reductase family type II enzyme iron-sulfur subunit
MPPVATKQELESSKRQLAAVIDLNKCMGCQTCTVACKNIWTQREGTEHMRWASVATTPGRGYPRDWEQKGGGFDPDGLARPGDLTSFVDCGDHFEFNHGEVFFEGNGQRRKLEPRSASGEVPEWGYNWDEDQAAGSWPNPYFFYLARKCNHCSKPACVEACPRKAILKRDDGVVLIDQDQCRGYRFCVEACPYSMVYFNLSTKKSEKCIECFPRIERGIAPACHRQCVGRARAYGYLDDPSSQVHKLVREWGVALPLRPESGTQPNVYYIPPLSPLAYDEQGRLTDQGRIPARVLERCFGPDVHRALATLRRERERQRSGERSELMDLLISRRWHDRFAAFTAEPV